MRDLRKFKCKENWFCYAGINSTALNCEKKLSISTQS